MKFIKGFLIVTITLFLIYIVLAFLGPKNYELTRSIEINAPKEIVWKQVIDFEKWVNWSPWEEKDTSVKNTYEGKMGEIGSKMSWIGDEKLSGTGSMEITAIQQYDSINYLLSFVIPFEMQSVGGFSFQENEGKTLLTWYDKGDFSFFSRPFMLFMDLDKQIGPDFERGLFKIDSIANEQFKLLKAKKEFKISETIFPGNNYVAVRHKTTFSETMTQDFYETNFKYLGIYVGENQAKLSGAPSTITYTWNELDSTCELAVAFPIEGLTAVNQPGYEFISINKQKAVLAKCFGSYDKIGTAHDKIQKYMAKKGLKNGLVIEEYINDPASVPENEIETHIYYLIEE